ncbi:MAG: hypothetical protein AB7S78_06535 [Candidatus Omnitrophota bacterium]
MIERRNFLREVMRTTKIVSASTMKTIQSIEKEMKLSVDDDINAVGQVCRRIVRGIERIDQE